MLSEPSQKLLDVVASAGAPPMADGSVQDARAGFEGQIDLIGPGSELPSVQDVAIPAPRHEIVARVYEPAEEPVAAILYLRGGGWVVGTLESTDAFARTLAVASQSVVIAVDYRRAPEHVFPAAVNDATNALNWVAAHCDLPLVVFGDSAGGNLAAAATLRATNRGAPQLALQILVYPVADHIFDRPSYVEHGHSGLLVGTDEMKWFWDHYVPDPARRSDPDASPLRARSFRGLPPTYLVVAEYDPLRDEARELAQRMAMDGVDVTVRYYDDELHGFLTMVNYLPAADAAVADIGRVIRETVHEAEPLPPDRLAEYRPSWSLPRS